MVRARGMRETKTDGRRERGGKEEKRKGGQASCGTLGNGLQNLLLNLRWVFEGALLSSQS